MGLPLTQEAKVAPKFLMPGTNPAFFDTTVTLEGGFLQGATCEVWNSVVSRLLCTIMRVLDMRHPVMRFRIIIMVKQRPLPETPGNSREANMGGRGKQGSRG